MAAGAFGALDSRVLGLALAAASSNALPGFLVDEVLAARLARLLQLNVLLGRVPVGDDGWVLGTFLEEGCTAFPALLLLRLGALGWRAWALFAADMLAVGALPGETKESVAVVALAVHPHADGLLDAEGIALGRIPLGWLDLEAEALAEFLGALLEELRSGYQGSLHDGLLCRLALIRLSRSRSSTGRLLACEPWRQESRLDKWDTYLVEAAASVVVAAGAVNESPGVRRVDCLFLDDSPLFKTVLMRVSTLVKVRLPFSSLGTDGSPCAGALMTLL